MQSVVWNSQKGGSGKTNLCAHLSVEAERAGDGPVYLIDTDPQGTLSTWHKKRQAEVSHRVEIPFSSLRPGLRNSSNSKLRTVSSTPPRSAGRKPRDLFAVADL